VVGVNDDANEGVAMKRPRNFEACAVREADGAVCVLGDYTTVRAALNAMAFRGFFGPAGVVYRVRDKRSGEFVSELARA
jgi:hypothetical protein